MAYPSNTSDMIAQDQIKAFVERIMRMREEAKAINDDIREIYAEAKANGFDKTVLGKIVIHVERRSKDNAKMLEAQTLFDLYLDAFDGATGTINANAHTHEKIGLAAPALSGDDRQANTKAAPITETDAPKPLPAATEEVAFTEPAQQPAEAKSSEQEPSEPEGSGGVQDRCESTPPSIQSDDPTEPAGDSPNTVASRPNSDLHPAALNALKLRPHCLHASDLTQCAGVGKKHCAMCLAAHADAEGMSA